MYKLDTILVELCGCRSGESRSSNLLRTSAQSVAVAVAVAAPQNQTVSEWGGLSQKSTAHIYFNIYVCMHVHIPLCFAALTLNPNTNPNPNPRSDSQSHRVQLH